MSKESDKMDTNSEDQFILMQATIENNKQDMKTEMRDNKQEMKTKMKDIKQETKAEMKVIKKILKVFTTFMMNQNNIPKSSQT